MNRIAMLVAVSMALAGCGAGMAEDGDELNDLEDELRAPKPSGATITATDGVYGGFTRVTFHPGTVMDQQLFVGATCSQNGVVVLGSSTWELHWAAQAGVAGYSQVGDHFEVVLAPLMSQIYTGGHADCVVTGYFRDHRGRLVEVATNHFAVD